MSRKVDKVALARLVERGGVPYKQNSRSYLLHCPKCSKQKLYVQKSDGRSKCMKCGDDYKGWADFILAPMYGLSVAELKALLYDGEVLPGTPEHFAVAEFIDPWGEFEDDDVVIEEGEALPRETMWSPDCVELDSRAGLRGMEYLESRGIDYALASKYGIRYNVPERRVCVPVYVNGVLRGWQGRYIYPTEFHTAEGEKVVIPKILTAGELAGRVVMFQDGLQAGGHGIMMEGPFDAMKADLCGGNTATMGKSVTAQQLRMYLKSGIKRLYLGLDDDAAEQTMRIVREVASHVDVFVMVPPAGREDFGACTTYEVLDSFHSAQRVTPTHVFVYLPDFTPDLRDYQGPPDQPLPDEQAAGRAWNGVTLQEWKDHPWG